MLDKTVFYEDFIRDLERVLEKNKGPIAAHVSDIFNEAQKLGFLKKGMEKEFLKDMFSYFEKKGMQVNIDDLSIIGYLSCDLEK